MKTNDIKKWFKSLNKWFKNIELKLISLAIATTLWVMVTGKDYRYGDFNIPIELKGLQEDLIIVSSGADNREVKNATVRIRASETVIRTMDERSMFLRVDITNLNQGHHLIRLSDDLVMGRPPGAEITDIFPSDLELDIEQVMIKSFVVVNAEILGKPADNYNISQIICNPPSVSLRGPKSLVEKIEKISTPQVNIDGLSEINLRRTLHLVPPHPTITVIPENVTLRIQIQEKLITQSFKDIPIELRNTKYIARINPKTLVVWVNGPISQIERITHKNIKLHIALKGDEPRLKNIRIEPIFECSPADSFPDVKLERFSQSFVDIILTNNKINK
ncbi:MAG TPA: CdaR family protein [archaeon]|nr:CdaR family protein [archaeon]